MGGNQQSLKGTIYPGWILNTLIVKKKYENVNLSLSLSNEQITPEKECPWNTEVNDNTLRPERWGWRDGCFCRRLTAQEAHVISDSSLEGPVLSTGLCSLHEVHMQTLGTHTKERNASFQRKKENPVTFSLYLYSKGINMYSIKQNKNLGGDIWMFGK